MTLGLPLKHGTTVTVVRDTQTETEQYANSYWHCLIVKMPATISDGQYKQPITTVQRLSSQEPHLLQRLNQCGFDECTVS